MAQPPAADERLPHRTRNEAWLLAVIGAYDLHVESGRESRHAPAGERAAVELVLDNENAVVRGT